MTISAKIQEKMINNFSFKILSKDKKSNARTGEIQARHGKILTPAFVPVGTAASVKSLTPEDLQEIGISVFFVNTYHMLFRPGVKTIKKMGGLHQFTHWPNPIMTDSGGFQAFSLGENGPKNSDTKEKNLVEITNEGIYFKSVWNGEKVFLNPEKSIKAQKDLDSDIMMSFDECTFYPISKKRAYEAMERTHDWALRSLKAAKEKFPRKQALYGIVQGSVFPDLRKKSADFISRLPFDGLAIGSVANSREPREKVFAVLDWTMPFLLRTNKPIHFLGIGEIEDLFLSIEKGIDTLDCVTPTRLGRMGWVFSQKAGLKNRFRFDITKTTFQSDQKPLEEGCQCYTCQNYSRSYLNHLFRSRELLAYRLASIHNLFFFENLMKNVRQSIEQNQFLKLKKKWLGYD